MGKQNSKRKYLIAICILGALTILMSLGRLEGDTFDKVFRGIGSFVGGCAIGLLSYPFVWLFKRKSENKFAIALTIGAFLSLIITIGSLG